LLAVPEIETVRVTPKPCPPNQTVFLGFGVKDQDNEASARSLDDASSESADLTLIV
jgi:hypothetical protein